MTTRVRSLAIESIADMLALADSEERRLFPSTDLYSEGWMLRLVLDAAFRGSGKLPFPILNGARWYSEARLASPFMRRAGSASSHLAEGFTHADGVVGHFTFRNDTEAGLELLAGAEQLAVIEAKMFSKLARGTTRASEYDQAARNVACMAWVLDRSGRAPEDLKSVAFHVWAPREQLEHEPTFRSYVDKESIIEKVERRVAEYKCDPDRHEELRHWLDRSFRPLMRQVEIQALAWEDVIAGIGGPETETIAAFYDRCLQHNRPVARQSK